MQPVTHCKYCGYEITRDIAGNWWHLRNNAMACSTNATPKDTYYEPLWPKPVEPKANVGTEICHECKALVLPSQIGLHEAWHLVIRDTIKVVDSIKKAVEK